MRKINDLSEFEHGKEYQRIAGDVDLMVEVFMVDGRPWARSNEDEWKINLGLNAHYYRTDVLSSSEEL